MGKISIKPGTVRIFVSPPGSIRKLVPNTGVHIIVDWLRWADEDYIAARQLLLSNLLKQGAGLSNTAIEKYFKTIFLIKKLPFRKNHDIPDLFKQLKENGISLNLNPDYLALLFKLYKLRYPDDLNTGLSVGIDRTRLLTELDFSVFEVRKWFNSFSPREPIGNTIEDLSARKDTRLLEKNCYFGSANREALFAEDSSRFAMRVLEPDDLTWAEYETFGVPDTRNFKIKYAASRKVNKMNFRLPLE